MIKNCLHTLALSAFIFAGAQMLNAEPGQAHPALTKTIQADPVKFPYGTDLAEALKAAKTEKQMLLVEFTGSDWCPPCKRLKKEILSTQAFADYVAANNLRFVELDFPRTQGAIPPELMKKRTAICAQYGVRGFPTVLIVDSDGLPYGAIVGGAKNTEDYTKMISAALNLKTKFAQAVAAAQEKTGADRAKALAAALEMLQPNCRNHQKEVIEDLIANDPDDSLGFKKKSREAALLADQREMLKTFFTKHRKKITPEALRASRNEAMELLKMPEIQPIIALALNKFISDGYAMSHDLENALKHLQAAHDSAPETPEGKALVPWIKNMEQIIREQQEAKNRKATPVVE